MTGKSCVTQILIVSDHVREILYTPAIREQFSGVNLVISCGDLPFPYLEYIVTMLNVPLLYVPGNHDRPTYTDSGRIIEAPEGATNVDGRVITLTGKSHRPLTVVGFGGSMYYGGSMHQYTEWQMRKRVARVEPTLLVNRWIRKRGVDLLVTHAPPYGVHDGTDQCHTGFRAFGGFIRRYQPMFHLHGHVHPSYGYDVTPQQYHGTEIRNTYGYDLLEMEP